MCQLEGLPVGDVDIQEGVVEMLVQDFLGAGDGGLDVGVDRVSNSELRGLVRRRVSFGGPTAPTIVIAVPARNEAAHIGRCLQALCGQTTGAPDTGIGIVVFLNNCADGSFEAASAVAARCRSAAIRIYDATMAPDASHAGGARRAAMELAAGWLEEQAKPGQLIMTTDADSQPSSDWVAANRAAILRGVDCVTGRIELDPVDALVLPASLHARGRLEAAYENLLTEMFSHLDPRSHDPWPRHAAEPGASLAITLPAYRAVGGLPSMPLGEDRAMVAALEDRGFLVRHDPAISVITSGRTIGRAEGGVADTIRLRCDHPDAPCDPYLEPASTAFLRGTWRAKLRALHATDMAECSECAEALGLDTNEVKRVLRGRSFASAWRELEGRSPALRRHLVRPADLPGQIRQAQELVEVLRQPASHMVAGTCMRDNIVPGVGAAPEGPRL